jgi:hypothetical protein
MTDPTPEPGNQPEPKNDPKPGDPAPKDYTPPATQADLDRIIADRLQRERSRYSDYDDLRRKADAHDKALEEAQSEQEKAVTKARKEGEAAAIERANERLKSAEARAMAAQLRFRNPALAARTVDLSGVKVADDGTVDTDALKSVLGDLAKAEPYMVGEEPPKPPPSFNGGPRPSNNKPESTPGLGRMRDAYASGTKK